MAELVATGLHARVRGQVLLDCEGTDAFDQTKDYSTQIFSLGLLLSSMLVFNQVREWHAGEQAHA
jgi:hypothetical protein